MSSPLTGQMIAKAEWERILRIMKLWHATGALVHSYGNYPYTTNHGRRTQIEEHRFYKGSTGIVLIRDIYAGRYIIRGDGL